MITRDDWRSLSAILARYAEMKWRRNFQDEKELRGMLVVWLRDHDMPQEALEKDWAAPESGAGCGLKRPALTDRFYVRLDQTSGEVVEAYLLWSGYYDEQTFALRFERRDGEYLVMSE